MTTSIPRPPPTETAQRAQEILTILSGDPEFARLREACARHSREWVSFLGYALVDGFDVEDDARHLFPDAARVIATKSAVYELTEGDEYAAGVPAPVVVAETVHALTAQTTVISRIGRRTGIQFVGATDREETGAWTTGDYTSQVFGAAGWPMHPRYWITEEETRRRKAALSRRYALLGIYGGGCRITPGLAGQP